MIPKEGRDPIKCSNYRSILLLNLNLKIFTNILSMRLLPHISRLILLYQAGFTPGREARDNTIRVLSLIHHTHVSSVPNLLLSVDAEKSFDRVNWDFITLTMKHIGLGPRMEVWLDSLYSRPTSSVSSFSRLHYVKRHSSVMSTFTTDIHSYNGTSFKLHKR